VRVVAGGDALLSPSVTRQLIYEFVSHPRHDRHSPAELDDLTEREREVLTLIAAGLATPRSPNGSSSAPPPRKAT
jgi:DNA-binding NarL/FixJ family response regulator